MDYLWWFCFSPGSNENNNWLPIITRGICKQLEVQFSLCWQILRTLLCAKVKAEIQDRLNKKKFYTYTYKWFLNLDHCGDRIKAFTELIQVPLSKGTGNINRTIGKATDSQLLLSYYSTVIPPSGRIKGFRTYMFGVLGFWNPFFFTCSQNSWKFGSLVIFARFYDLCMRRYTWYWLSH